MKRIATVLATLRIFQTSRERLRTWRGVLAPVVTALVLAVLLYWGWQHYHILQRIFIDLHALDIVGLGLLLTLSVFVAALNFTLLVRSLGYPFTHWNGYHSLNLSQIAAFVPGKIWGFAGLAGLLWSQGISKRDSVLVIFLHTFLILSAAVVVGMCGLIPVIGWTYTLLCLTPVLLLLFGRRWCETWRSRFFPESSPLPLQRNLFLLLIVSVGSWIVISACFVFLVYNIVGQWPTSPLLIASAFVAGYVGGFVSLLTPSGLGVREGIIAAILGPTLGSDEALALALVFRVVQTAVVWLHIAITCLTLTYNRRTLQAKTDSTSICTSLRALGHKQASL